MHSHFAVQQLSVNDLLVLREELNTVRAKWYDVGMQLRLSVGTLDAIKAQYLNDPSDCLRETLKVWLKTYPSPSWTNIVDALGSKTLGETGLAVELKHRYCLIQYSSIVPPVSTPTPLPHNRVTPDPSPAVTKPHHPVQPAVAASMYK